MSRLRRVRRNMKKLTPSEKVQLLMELLYGEEACNRIKDVFEYYVNSLELKPSIDRTDIHIVGDHPIFDSRGFYFGFGFRNSLEHCKSNALSIDVDQDCSTDPCTYIRDIPIHIFGSENYKELIDEMVKNEVCVK